MSNHNFDDLEDLTFGGETATAPAPVKTYPCEKCAGTGTWKSYTGTKTGKCHACNGKGHFKTSAKDRAKARAAAKKAKVEKLLADMQAFTEAHPGLIKALSEMKDWNDFARSLIEQFLTRGSLSEKQVAAAQKMIAKCAASAKAASNKAKAAPTVDLSAIRTMFDTALGNGLKRPTYRAEGIVIARAPDTGKNAGHLYVKAGAIYQGKITPEDKFLAVKEAEPTTLTALQTIAESPAEAAMKYGKATGSCSCCGRTLTDPKSIAAGIGPICASNFGL